MMIYRNELIKAAIEADIEITRVQAKMGYKYYMHYTHVESIANLLGLDKENLRNAVYQKFNDK